MAEHDTSAPVASQFASDEDMIEIVEAFVAAMPARAGALREAWARREIDEVRSLAHQLKGASAGYGYPALSEAAGALEDELRSLSGLSGEAVAARAEGAFEGLVALCERIVVG
jgi:HPt (histidine-containing phosphotransfer) domain-containing protein